MNEDSLALVGAGTALAVTIVAIDLNDGGAIFPACERVSRNRPFNVAFISGLLPGNFENLRSNPCGECKMTSCTK
jgi:hypothetical protein